MKLPEGDKVDGGDMVGLGGRSERRAGEAMGVLLLTSRTLTAPSPVRTIRPPRASTVCVGQEAGRTKEGDGRQKRDEREGTRLRLFRVNP